MGFATGPEQAIGLGLTICRKWLGPPLWRGRRTERRLGYHWVLTKLVGDDLEVVAAALYFQYEFGATSISGGYAWICGMLDRVGHRSTLTAAIPHAPDPCISKSEKHTSELQSPEQL